MEIGLLMDLLGVIVNSFPSITCVLCAKSYLSDLGFFLVGIEIIFGKELFLFLLYHSEQHLEIFEIAFGFCQFLIHLCCAFVFPLQLLYLRFLSHDPVFKSLDLTSQISSLCIQLPSSSLGIHVCVSM